MDSVTLQKIQDAIAKSANIGIAVGRNPNIDQMAAALSLFLLLKQAKKEVSIATPENPLVEVSSLVGINKVQTTLGGGASGDLVVSFPYTEGEIEKVSYTLENNFLNIIVKAGEHGLSFDEQDIKYTRGTGNVDLLIIVGTPKLSDLGDLIGGESIRDAKIINIDNHADNQQFGDTILVMPQAASVSEVMSEVVLSLGFRTDRDVAQNLLRGIVYATDNFQGARVSPLSFEMAGILMKQGAIREDDHRGVVQQLPPKPQPKKQWLDEVASKVQTDDDSLTPASDDKKAPLDWLSPKVYKSSDQLG